MKLPIDWHRAWIDGLMLVIAFAGISLWAQNFDRSRAVLDAAGGNDASANYKTTNAVGQPAPLGSSLSSNYQLVSGFLAGGGVNFAPQITQIADQQMDEGDTLDVAVSAIDPNNHQLTLSVNNLPGFGSFTDNGDGSGVIRFTPSDIHSGVYPDITVTVRDNGLPILADSTSFTLTVNDALGIDDPGTGIPQAYALSQNFPNPFNPSTTIRFALPQSSSVTLTIFDVAGRQVKSLSAGKLPAGYHEVLWDGKDAAGAAVSSGMYFYRLEAGKFQQVRKMLLMK